MLVEIWSDFVCPWCGLGAHRLQQALSRFEHAEEVRLKPRAFQLDERAAAGVTESVSEMLRTRKGISDAQVKQMTAHVEALAAADGLSPYHVLDNRVGNTSLAHQLVAWADETGQAATMWRALFTAYFAEQKSIFDESSLVQIAGRIGLDVTAAKDALRCGRYAQAVVTDGQQARALGANGVPFTVIDRKMAVSGAQSVDAFLEALQTAWARR